MAAMQRLRADLEPVRRPAGSTTSRLRRAVPLVVLLPALLVLADAGNAGLALAAPPAGDAPRDTVLRGEVVETGCFVMAGRRGESHRQCALACARAGQDLAVLDDKTKAAYLLVQDFTTGTPVNPLLEHVGRKVEVRATVVERGGIQGIIARQVKPLDGGVRR